MKILLVKAGCKPVAKTIDGTLESMQAMVDGLIEVLYPFDDEVALVCNEEGKLRGLPLNRGLCDCETGELIDIIAGDFFLCGAPADAEDFTSLTDLQLERYKTEYQHPEYFFRTPQGVAVIKG